MTQQQIETAVWALIDEYSLDIGQEEYADMLESIAADAKIKAEAVREELED